MKAASRFSLVLVTAGTGKNARFLARSLVDSKLAACVNLIPRIRSVYRWKGKVCEETEWLLWIKARTRDLSRLEQFVLSKHGYEVPEILALPFSSGNAKYLHWFSEQTHR